MNREAGAAVKKVIITDHPFPSLDLHRKVIEPHGFVLEDVQPICRTEDDVIRTCGDADVLIVQWAPITRRVLEALPRVKCIVRYGVGVNNFDLNAARDLGVTAANVPDFCVEEVSDHAMAMILSLCRRIPQDHSQIVRGDWGIGHLRPIPAPSDMTLGLIAFGKIPQRVAAKANAFGFTVVAYDPYQKDSVFADCDVRRADLETLLAESDVISVHCPQTPETEHLINRETIAKMKHGVIFVNTSRGGIVDEKALIEALKSRKINGAGLDVFEVEPLPAGSPLRELDNVIMSSHAASVSERAVELLQIKAAEAARDFLLGKKPASTLV